MKVNLIFTILFIGFCLPLSKSKPNAFWSKRSGESRKITIKNSFSSLEIQIFLPQLSSLYFYGLTLNRMIHRNMDSLSIKVEGEKDIILMKKLIQEGFNFNLWDKNERRRKKKTLRNIKIQDS